MPVSNKINMVTKTPHTVFKNYSLPTPINQHQRLWKGGGGSLLGDQVAERQAAGATFASCVPPDSPSTLLFPGRMPTGPPSVTPLLSLVPDGFSRGGLRRTGEKGPEVISLEGPHKLAASFQKRPWLLQVPPRLCLLTMTPPQPPGPPIQG